MKVVKYKDDLYIGKHLSFHKIWRGKDFWEFYPYPSIVIDSSRVLIGLFFFSVQYSFKEHKVEDYS